MVRISFTEDHGMSSMTTIIEEDIANSVVSEVDRLARSGLIPKGFYIPEKKEEN